MKLDKRLCDVCANNTVKNVIDSNATSVQGGLFFPSPSYYKCLHLFYFPLSMADVTITFVDVMRDIL